jgi:hypothetical protein
MSGVTNQAVETAAMRRVYYRMKSGKHINYNNTKLDKADEKKD